MKILLIFGQGIFASLGNSAAVGALMAESSSTISPSTLVPLSVLCAGVAITVGIAWRVAYKQGRDDQKMKNVMVRLKELEDKE